MPVLEMAIVWANLYHSLRRRLVTERRTVATQLTSTNPHKKSRHRRRHMSIGRGLRTSHRLREIHLNASVESIKPEVEDSSTRENFTVALTSCPEVPCLQVMPTMSPAFLKRQQLQKRLLERHLILNAMDVLQMQWSHWWHICWPSLVAASVQVSFGSPKLCNSLMGFYEEGDRDPPLLALACFLVQHFKKICKRSETALCNAGPGPYYRTTSATMELIDIRELLQQINEALVDYLLRFSDNQRFFYE
ncbi:hypothetical protein KR038_002747 [Drosophila bunnanda]|nr:hypothetical protein KR038_002747 [Drosophila bunnanda]